MIFLQNLKNSLILVNKEKYNSAYNPIDILIFYSLSSQYINNTYLKF
nr:MAG TPA: hypothetical protein [Caudoviricetes sp.]